MHSLPDGMACNVPLSVPEPQYPPFGNLLAQMRRETGANYGTGTPLRSTPIPVLTKAPTLCPVCKREKCDKNCEGHPDF